MSEQNKDAERAAFEASLRKLPGATGAIEYAIETFDGESYGRDQGCSGLDLNGMFVVWKLGRASLPVGVPDGFRVMKPTGAVLSDGDRWEVYAPCGSGGIVSEHDVKDWVVRQLMDAMTAAPTVKAEQVDCLYCQGHGDVTRISGQTAESYAEHDEECPGCSDTGLAPSLPAAGSVVEDVEVVAHIAIDDPTPEEHGDWDIEPDAAKINELARRGGGHIPLMTVAQHNRIVDAISVKPAALVHGIGIPSVAEFGEWIGKEGASPDSATRGMLLALFKWTVERVCVLNANRAAVPNPADHPYQEGIAEDLERSDWTPLEALQWYAAGRHFDVADGRTRIIDTGAVASNALKHASLAYLELKGDAELSELRAALSAQQSTQDVSVPRELLRQAAEFLEAHSSGPSIEQNIADDFRALLNGGEA